jgi:cobaltochelatase CobN
MKEAGYSMSRVPARDTELIEWMQAGGRQIGMWSQNDIDKLVKNGSPVLIPVNTYKKWLNERVPEEARKQLIEKWGQPPGKFMVWKNSANEQFIVIPRIALGNVILLPQPLRGEAQDVSLTHDRRVPPPHNYLATYFWLEKEFHADALVHFGTHGSEISLPGKQTGLCDKDWDDIILGSMPNINPWIIDNLGEAVIAKQRAYAVLIGYLPPPLVNAELSDSLLNLENDINKWDAMDASQLKEQFRASITKQVLQTNFDTDAQVKVAQGGLLTDEQIQQVSKKLHDISNETVPTSLHILGEPPGEDLLIPYLVSCLRKKFIDELAAVFPVPAGESDRGKYLRKKAEEILGLTIWGRLTPIEAVRAAGGKIHGNSMPDGITKGIELAADLNTRFKKTGQEIDNLLAALDGKYVPPGPGMNPVRNPGAVPTGRNLYMLNPDEVPSRPSWELGKTLVDQMLGSYRQKHGNLPEKVAFTLSPFSTFRDYGVMEAQILYLIGAEPVWDDKNLANDIKIIPRELLNRPRIDVFISAHSIYRDYFAGRMLLIDKAIRMVSQLDEPDNGVRQGTLKLKDDLVKRNLPEDKATMLSTARIFGYPPGQYGSPAYYYLIERSGEWDSREQLMQAYLRQVKYVYSKDLWGVESPEAYEEAIQKTNIVLRTWSDNTSSPLSNKYTWYTGGSLAMAVHYLTGQEPE